jgi:PAS domain-containing protein
MQEILSPMIAKIMQLNPVLHTNDLQLRRLLDRLPVGVYTCDAFGTITSCNRQATAIWGRMPELHNPRERFCGSHSLYSAADGSPLTHVDSWMARALRERRAFNACAIIIGRVDGRRIPVLAYANPSHDASGYLVGACCVLASTNPSD